MNEGCSKSGGGLAKLSSCGEGEKRFKRSRRHARREKLLRGTVSRALSQGHGNGARRKVKGGGGRRLFRGAGSGSSKKRTDAAIGMKRGNFFPAWGRKRRKGLSRNGVALGIKHSLQGKVTIRGGGDGTGRHSKKERRDAQREIGSERRKSQ